MASLGIPSGLTQQMASLNQVVQAQQRMQSLLNGLVNPDDETIANEERRKREKEEQRAEEEVSKKFIWRLCVYSGEDLPRDTMYVYIKIVDQLHGDKIFKSNVSSESSKPVWEFVVEETIMVDSIHGPPRLEIQLYGQRVLLDVLDRYLGQAVLKLPAAPTLGPMKNWLPVTLNTFSALNDKISAQFGVSRKARLNVVWQVCDEKHPGPAPDLIRIAEMDEDAADKRSYQFHLKVVNVKLRRATEGPRRLAVCLRLIQPDGEVSKASPVQHSPQAWSCPESRVIENLEDPSKEMPHADPDEECNTAVWCEDRRLGWTMPTWMLRESHLQLLSYTIEAQLLMYSSLPAKEQVTTTKKKFRFFRHSNLGGAQDDKPTKLGVWRESLGDLLDSIEQSDEGLVCEAPFTSREGTEVATVRMEIDVSSSLGAHRMPPNLVSQDIFSWPMEKAPVRRGAPSQEVMKNKVQYFVTVMVDSLPSHELCLPYVRVSMGAVSECTEAKMVHSVNNVSFDKALMIQSTLINRKAKIEILNKDMSSVFNEDKVIGQGVIYDLEPDKDYWIHCYGGAADAKYPDVALQMIKGAVKPASTHTATMAIRFGTKIASKDFGTSMRKMRKPFRLKVRFYSGVNLNSYKNQKVNVIVKVPGCRLPDEVGAQQIQKNLKELETFAAESARPKSPNSQIQQLRRKALLENDPAPEHFNSNLLSFPGEVDAAGILHFTENSQRLRWVERATPSDWPLEVPPNTQLANFYIVAVGHESEPPQAFGRLRLVQKPLDKVSPRWKQLSFDTSVVALPEAYYKSNLAGFVLGAASLMPEKGKSKRKASQSSWGFWNSQGPTLPSGQRGVCCSSSKKQVFQAFLGEDIAFEVQRPERRKTVYCHVDLLAARELPAMDDDGLVDPSYSIQVKDQTLLYPSGIMKSLSPSFMHRIRIPIEMEVEPEPTVGLPMMASAIPFPPIIVKILDRDERKVLGVDAGETFEEVGQLVIKPSVARTHCVGRNGEQNAEVYPLLGYVQEEDYVLGDQGSLFASKMPVDLDLNRHHVAKWYAIDKAAQAPFDTSTGGEEDSWQKRPRVLAAANYSFQANVLGGLTQGHNLAKGAASGISIHELHTHQSSRFKIDFCLLGLRNLPQTLVDCKLYVSSFWEGGAIELHIGSGGLSSNRNFNFMVDDASEGREHLAQWKPLLRIDDEQTQDSTSSLWAVKLKDLTGLKIQPPVYEVPVIPYLQQDKLKPGRWSMTESDTGQSFDILVRFEGAQSVEVQKYTDGQLEEVRHPGSFSSGMQVIRFTLEDTEWSGQVTNFGTEMPMLQVTDLKDVTRPSKFYSGTWHEEDPFVLLPSLTIQLKNPATGADHGTLTVALNQLGTQSSSWMQICRQELAKLPKELHQWSCHIKGEARTGAIQPLRGIKYTDEAYDAIVDVFASHSGYVDFDENVYISRTLQDNCLFKVCPNRDKEDDAEDDGSVIQFFNIFDWMAGDSRRLSEPFDERFWPRLCCGPGYDKEVHLEELPHIPDHCMVEDADRLIGKILAWMDAKENAIEHSLPRPSQPLGPAKLFENFFHIQKVASFAGIKKHDLETMSTTQIHRKLRKVGWRFSTHLAAPELVPSSGVLNFFTDSQLNVNRHTFMVQVGHQIGKDRDSHILCRLRMDLPKNFLEPMRKILIDCREHLLEHDEELPEAKSMKSGFLERLAHSGGVMGQTTRTLHNIVERLKRVEAGTSNYFMVKFKQPGVVVWAAPDHQKAWDRPGTLLFAVKLLHQPDVVVPVVVPSFDLRYPQETSWKVQKTSQMRFHDAERRIAWALDKEREAKGTESIRRSPAAPDLEVDEVVEELDDNRDMASFNRGTHGRMATSAGAFVCRLKRKAGALPFDREQNSDWYRLVLGESFPELRQYHDDELVKDFFFSKFMNLQRTLALPHESGETVLKGHVNVQKVPDGKDDQIQLDCNDFPVENLWTSGSFFVALTLCTFTKLDQNVDCSEIYFKIQLGGDEQRTPVVVSSLPQKIISVYHCVTFETQVPGSHELNLQVFAKGAMGFSDSLIGECKFDLEDRCLAMKWKEFRSGTNEEFLRNHLSPPSVGRFQPIQSAELAGPNLPWTAPQKLREVAEGRGGMEVRPSRSPGARLPLESKVICMKDTDMNADSRVGLLRCVLEMHPQSMPEAPRSQRLQSFEIRVSILNVDNIKVYKDFGQRNDLFVQMKFRSISLDGKETKKTEKTDIHGWAHDFASFNQRFLFPLTAPAVKCGIEFTLMDFDRGVSAADLVYYPQTFSLDRLVEMAYDDWSSGRDPVGTVAGNVVFDSWPSTNMVFEGSRLGRCIRRRQRKGSAAKLNLTVEIVPREVADAAPAITGVFAPPKDRLSIQMLATNPLKSIRVVLGPKLFNAIIVGTILGCSGIITFIVVLTIFHTQQIIKASQS